MGHIASLIKTKADYEAILQRIEDLWESAPGSPGGDELDVLLMLVREYEERVYPMGDPSPREMLTFYMEQNDWTQSDLVPYFGSKAAVSQFLSGQRRLSKRTIARLHKGLGMPLECLFSVEEELAGDSALA